MGWAIILLNVGLLISLVVWANFNMCYSRNLSRLYLMGIAFQAGHFVEEYYTGFYETMPSFFNADPWTGTQFVVFNCTWLMVFLLAAIGTLKNNRLSYLVFWFFLIIGCLGNGILHIGLSLIQQKYFPGTATAVLLFIIGIIMMRVINAASSKLNCKAN